VGNAFSGRLITPLRWVRNSSTMVLAIPSYHSGQALNGESGIKGLTVSMTFCPFSSGFLRATQENCEPVLHPETTNAGRQESSAPLAPYALNVESIGRDCGFYCVVLAFPPVLIPPEKRKADLSVKFRQLKIDEINANCCTFRWGIGRMLPFVAGPMQQEGRGRLNSQKCAGRRNRNLTIKFPDFDGLTLAAART